jgi:pimeloyl-ACP methyl ester carboxylesterase
MIKFNRHDVRRAAEPDRHLRWGAGWAPALALALALALSWAAPTGAESENPVIVQTVSFTIYNINRSAVSCPVDGKTYQIQGQIVGPSWAMRPGAAQRAITLYLHGLGGGQVIWRFDAVPNYDFALGMARLGQVSLAIDLLGHGASGHPYGFDSCLGGQADIAHQLVQALRAGAYSVLSGGTPVAFSRVALAGLSSGGAIAQLEAYSFRDVDALAVFSDADQDVSTAVVSALTEMGQVCQAGGQPSGGPGTPGGYAYFAQTTQELQALLFYNADPRVESVITSIRTKDPCGDMGSLGAVIGADQANLPTVTVPVLLVYGANDAILLPQAGGDQRQRYTGSKDVTLVTLAATGHILPLERTAPEFRAVVAHWLWQRGL